MEYAREATLNCYFLLETKLVCHSGIPKSDKPCFCRESIVCGALAVVVAVVAQQVLVPLHKRGTDIDARMDLTITTAQNRLIGSVDSQSTYADRPSTKET